jgi:hypothetical protein
MSALQLAFQSSRSSVGHATLLVALAAGCGSTPVQSDLARERASDSLEQTQDEEPGPAPGNEPVAPCAPADARSCLQGTSKDYKGNGPYRVRTKDVTIGQLGAYTIFYPATLGEGCKHPIVSWGNGTGVGGSGIYGHWHRHAASWGLVVIASHTASAGAQRYLENGIDYLLRENENPTSEFAGKLSGRAGVAGHSQGGIAATTAANHPAVQAEVCVEGGGFPPPKVAFLCETGVNDFLRGMCTGAYNAARGPAFLADHTGADHISTPTLLGAGSPAGIEFVRLYTAWFRCFLGDDASACGLFRGGKSAPVCSQSTYATCDGRNIAE